MRREPTMTTGLSRTENDSMGPMQVPASALWAASTQRAVENFPIAGKGVHPQVIHAMGLLKASCAKINLDLGKLPPDKAAAIIDAGLEIASGKLDEHFPVDVYQTGSGTSTNMNANEVISNRVSQKAGKSLGARDASGGGSAVHPNDHVNMGQSSNDTFPAAMHIAVAMAIHNDLIPALQRLHKALDEKARQWDDIVKIGRTHLMDATPIRMGQVFSGYAAQAQYSVARARRAMEDMAGNMPIGGTAVGTGINTHPEFDRRVCDNLTARTGITFTPAKNHFEAQAA
jgi:fumarate hydratase, class II